MPNYDEVLMPPEEREEMEFPEESIGTPWENGDDKKALGHVGVDLRELLFYTDGSK